jgi:hypothetical protein
MLICHKCYNMHEMYMHIYKVVGQLMVRQNVFQKIYYSYT